MKKTKAILFEKKLFFPDSDFSVTVEKKQPSIPFHKHDFGEIAFILNGSAVHYTLNEEKIISKGDVIIIYGDEPHGFSKLCNLHVFNILFDINSFDRLRDEFKNVDGFNVLFGLEPQLRKSNRFISGLKLSDAQLKKIEPLINLYEEECCDALPGYNITVPSLFKSIIVLLCRDYTHSDISKSDVKFKIEKIVYFIKENFHKKITFNHIVQLSGMSPTAFRHYFKKTTGYSPIKFLMRLRIAKAACLLSEENIKVKDVAFRVGFQNQSYFVKTFREFMGVTPKEYSKGE